MKKRDRNTMQALETSLRMLEQLKQGEASLAEYTGKEVVLNFIDRKGLDG